MPHNDLVCDGWQDADPASDERHVPPPYVDFSSSGFDGTEASEWGDGWAVETGDLNQYQCTWSPERMRGPARGYT